MTSFPGSVVSFTAKTDNVDYPQAAHINDLQNEVMAIEAAFTGELLSIGGLVSSANKIPYYTGADTAALLDLSTSTSLGTSDTTIPTQNAVKTYADAVQTYVDTSIAAIPGRVVKIVNTEVNVVSTTTETDLFSYTVPANSMGTNKAYLLEGVGSFLNNTGVNRAPLIKFYYGASGVTIYNTSIATSASRHLFKFNILLRASGATNAQYLYNRIDRESELAEAESAPGFTADSTSSQTLKMTVTQATSSSSLSFIMRHARLTYLQEV